MKTILFSTNFFLESVKLDWFSNKLQHSRIIKPNSEISLFRQVIDNCYDVGRKKVYLQLI